MAHDGMLEPLGAELFGNGTVGAVAHWLLEPNYFDRRTQDWPLVSARAATTITLLYLLGVPLAQKAMAGRKPVDMKAFSMCHNVFMVLLSAWMAAEALGSHYWCDGWDKRGLRIWGSMVQQGATFTPACYRVARVFWVHYLSKAYEFVDTFIMVLRRNDRQITFLHLYHHATVFFCWWLGMAFSPGGDGYLIVVVNSSVHVIMYSYYLLASLKLFRIPQAVKRSITTLQLTQFAFFIAHAMYGVIFRPEFRPQIAKYMVLAQAVVFLLLFLGFYRTAYKPRGKRGTKPAEAANGTGIANGKAAKAA